MLHLDDVRIVLLGHRGAGKSSSGNTILGREEFDNKNLTVQSIVRTRKVAGRDVTVVDTQGWIRDMDAKRTTELLKQRIVGSVSLCPPGPHAFLLVIELMNPFRAIECRAYVEHLERLGRTFWGHSVVLLTHGDQLGDDTMESRIERSGRALQWLVEKCGNRYHVINNLDAGNTTQVTKLLEKIEQLVASYGGCHYQMDRTMELELEKKMTILEERVRERVLELKKQREADKVLVANSPPAPALRIVLMGWKGAGKSSAGNTILGKEELETGGAGTRRCVKKQCEVAGRQVTIIDTPGWMFGDLTKVPEWDKHHVLYSLSLCRPGPHVVLLCPAVIAFGEEHWSSIHRHLKQLGDGVWKHVILLFAGGDKLEGTDIEHYIESEGEAVQRLVDKCGRRYHVFNNKERGDGAQVTELIEKMDEMLARNGDHHYEMGSALWSQLEERRTAAQRCLEKVQNRRQVLQEQGQLLPDLRMVLLGVHSVGKSTLADMILGREEFGAGKVTTKSSKRQALLSGRQITVVDTPGWMWGIRHGEQDNQIAAEYVSLCSPGPHAVLIVISLLVPFHGIFHMETQQQMAILGDNVWRHGIVIFTFGRVLGDISIEEHIVSEGTALQWLVEKCGNRYCVVDTETPKDRSRGAGVLELIDEMVAANRGCHYEIDRHILHGVQERKRCFEERTSWWQIVQRKREGSKGKQQQLQELRILLLGIRNSGKSSTGNTILGREVFSSGRNTMPCVMRQGKVARWQLTVVDTPGLPASMCLPYTHQLIKEEIVRSPSLCPPGPHVVLFTVSLIYKSSISFWRTVEEQLGRLGEKIWHHSMVLFTWGDVVDSTRFEERIEIADRCIQLLVEKCENRYHVLNNMSEEDSQVTSLLEKIEEMVIGNSGEHLEMDCKYVQKITEKRRRMTERAQMMLKKVQTNRKRDRPLLQGAAPLSKIRIVLMGEQLSGMDFAGITILGTYEPVREVIHLTCQKREEQAFGRNICVVTTPGWILGSSATLTSELCKEEITRSVSLCRPGPHVFLLVININEAFTKKRSTYTAEHVMLLGERVWEHVIILFTGAEWLGDVTIEEYIKSEKKVFRDLLQKCKYRYHVLNTEAKGNDKQVMELLEKVEEMVAGNGGHHYGADSCVVQKVGEMLEGMVEDREKEAKQAMLQTLCTSTHSQGEQFCFPELRIVMLGMGCSEKCAIGNTILGKVAFGPGETVRCEHRVGQVGKRMVSIVDTPGIRNNLNNTPELLKQEIVNGVFLCPPGPHAFLIVISASFFQCKLYNYLAEFLQMFSGSVWRHSLVLFSHYNTQKDSVSQQCMENEESLRSILQKCGNRYHTLNSGCWDDGSQVTELLEKIEHMVAENGYGHYEMDQGIVQEIQHNRAEAKEKAKQRLDKVTVWRETACRMTGKQHILSELRIVLLGLKCSGKSEAGNTILASVKFEEKKETVICQRRRGFVAGRMVTLVDTMGWQFQLPYSYHNMKNMVDCMYLCAPGPHAFLLVIDASHRFTEKNRQDVQDNMSILSERVWEHTVILFTNWHWSCDMPIEQHIECEGKALQWLVDKCDNRYHIFHHNGISKENHVDDLLDKLQEVVARNGGAHYEMDSNFLQYVEEQETNIEDKVQERQLREAAVQAARSVFCTVTAETKHLSEIRIVLLGAKMAGKSSACDTILGKTRPSGAIGEEVCALRNGQVGGRQVIVVDTPGWWLDEYTPSKEEIVQSVSLCPPGPHALLVVVNMSMPYTEKQGRPLEEYLQLLTASVWRHTMVLFTSGNWLERSTIQHHIEREGKVLQWLLDRCGHRYHVFDNMCWGDGTQVAELFEKIEKMVAENGGTHFATRSRANIGILTKDTETKHFGKVMEEKGRQLFQDAFSKNLVEETLQTSSSSSWTSNSSSSSDAGLERSTAEELKHSHDWVCEWLHKYVLEDSHQWEE